jgi:hypothetical protein
MPEDHWFPKAWVAELKKTLHQMAVLLAFKVRNRTDIALDVKLLDSFMFTLNTCPMFCADEAKMEDYSQIAEQVDLVTHGPLLDILPGIDFSYLNSGDEKVAADTNDVVH